MQEANQDNQNEDKATGVKYLVYADLLPALEKIASLGYKSKGGVGWAVNFVLRQFAQDAVAMLEKSVTEVAHFRFWMHGFQWEIKVTAPKGSQEAQMGLQIDPRSILTPQVLNNAEIQPVSRQNLTPQFTAPAATVSDPLADLMNNILG